MDLIKYHEENIYKQANLFSKEDMQYNLENFGDPKEGKKNYMYIAGYSGGGKSTISKPLAAKHNAMIVELDDLKRMANGKFDPTHSGTHPEMQEVMQQYIKHNPGMKERLNLYNYHTEYNRFTDFMKDYAKNNPDKRIIMEGIQALGDRDMDIPRHIVGTGAFESASRANQRAKGLPKGHHYGNPLKLNLGMYPKINNERKVLDIAKKVKSIEESHISPTMKRLMITATRHPMATKALGAGTLATLGLAGLGAAVTTNKVKDHKAKKQQNKVAHYEEGIYKEAMENIKSK